MQNNMMGEIRKGNMAVTYHAILDIGSVKCSLHVADSEELRDRRHDIPKFSDSICLYGDDTSLI